MVGMAGVAVGLPQRPPFVRCTDDTSRGSVIWLSVPRATVVNATVACSKRRYRSDHRKDL